MNHSIMSGTRNHLIRQLVFFDEQYSIFYDQYVRDYGKDKQIVDGLVKRYKETLEKLLSCEDEVLFKSLQEITLLGSSVKVLFEEDGFEESFTVVYPTDIDPDNNRISFLSPIGRQLLLAGPEDSIILESPVGTNNVQIREIRFSYMSDFTA
ncbi:GreA/GreB family elongation factor [Brevibacillus sp. NRS-1366]|uniref:GreA/GreB family elongation factor n=1 Tax=Brevibacillus sp. NRS-1366 TaxID=3233899 RepID=UPI003D22CC97